MIKSRSIVTKKCCCYFGCSNNSHQNQSITFFAFPKDDDRYDIWAKHAGLALAPGENKGGRFLCEVHFSNIYMCRSPRRTILLQSAIPYECDKLPGIAIESSDDTETLAADMIEVQQVDNEEQIETVAFLDEPLVEEEEMKDLNSTDDESNMESQPVEILPVVLSRKRKDPIAKIAEMKAKLGKKGVSSPRMATKQFALQLNDGTYLRKVRFVSEKEVGHSTFCVEENPASDSAPSGCKPTQKSPVSSSTKTVETVGEEKKDTSQKRNDVTEAKNEQISEFIFKGEEYIQMPKAVYTKQIDGLRAKVEYYENIVQTMRDVLDQANASNSDDS